jgi:putative addiction module component (TIGR02574 family)
MSPISVFDLSPSEKLQLVQDLWDDLAASPDDVPVHDWQKEELARRKANLQKNPASGLTGAVMAAELAMAPEAEQDIDEAYSWYERQRVGLGEDFLTSVDASIEFICRFPKTGTIVYESYRRALVRRFPYAVYFESTDELVIVYGVLHTSRDPNKWRERLP